ncbi:MAG: hypothetical protein HOO98_01650 [Nitrospira sp.]|nr:hypothetical protein [Nitrospira sp.]
MGPFITASYADRQKLPPLIAVGRGRRLRVETCRSSCICKAPHLTERQFLAAVVGARKVGSDEALGGVSVVGEEANKLTEALKAMMARGWKPRDIEPEEIGKVEAGHV